MREEQRTVLRLLEEGKITAQEAEALLKALLDGSEPAERGSKPQTDPWVRVEKMGEDFASKVEVAAERFSRSIEHNLGDKLSKLPKVLARLPFIGQGERQEFTSVVRGKVGAGEFVPIEISNANGSIQVQGWEEDDYQLTVIQRLRGDDRELASSRLFALGWEDGAEREDFRLTVPNLGDLSVTLNLLVPKERMYEAKLQAQNGSLRIENLKACKVTTGTVNGSTKLYSLEADTISGEGGNGPCEMKDVRARLIKHSLGNGSYRALVSAAKVDLVTTNGSLNVSVLDVPGRADYKLRTTNGAINVSLPPQTDWGLSLELRTSVGRISTDVGSLEITGQERQAGGWLLTGHSIDYADKHDRLDLDASSTSGSIVISTRES